MNGRFPHPAVIASEPIRRDDRVGSLVRAGLVLILLGTATALILWALPRELLSWHAVELVALWSALVVLLYLTLGISAGRARHPKKVALVIVWFLISSEAFFMRFTEGEETLRGTFTFAAYAEASMWALALAALLIVTLGSPKYLHGMFRGSYKWLSLYGILCLVSTILSPQPLFSLGWALKLSIAILLIELYGSHVTDADDIRSFIRALFWAFAVISIAPLVSALFDVAIFGEEGRMGGYVVWGTATTEAGILVLLAMTLSYSSRSSAERKLLVAVGTLGVFLMFLYGGKTGILAGVLCAFLFFALQKKLGLGLGLTAGIVAVGTAIILFTPLGGYLQEYKASGLATTVTGRTGVWDATIPAIWTKPVFGHGFMAAKFLSTAVEVQWAATTTHNGFLEVLYNNGLAGLTLVLAMNVVIVKNLSRVIRGSFALPSIRSTAAGCLAIYANLLINGMPAAIFGGRVHGPFIMLVALVGISDWLLRANNHAVALSPVSGAGF